MFELIWLLKEKRKRKKSNFSEEEWGLLGTENIFSPSLN